MVADRGERATCTACGRHFRPNEEQRARVDQARRNDWTVRLYCPEHTPAGGKDWETILPGPS